jgi:hypothetical protein
MKALLVFVALAPATLMASPRRAIKPPPDASALLHEARAWVETEHALAATTPVQAGALVEHWEKLHALRLGFERLERRGELRHAGEARRTALRHVLAQILGERSEIDLDTAPERLQQAGRQRADDFVALARVARQAFDFDVAQN